ANGLPTINNAAFALDVLNVPVGTAFVGFGTAVVWPGIDLPTIGMGGCFAHTNLDLGLFTAAAVAAVAGSVCRGQTCCGTRLASKCWSARSARARGACWRRSTIRRRSRGCSRRSGGPRRGSIRRGAGHRRLGKGTRPT
ncbi:MAG: hypothetical protein ACK548_18205, partial [Planctomycetota bacterium]